MADEDKQEQPEQPEAAEEQAEAPDAAEPAAEAPAEEPAAEEAPAAEAPAEEPAEQLSPKERRRAARSRASGPAGPQRSVEERVAARAEERRRASASRRSRRRQERERAGEPGQGTPPAERVPGARKVRLGTVTSTKADKTITVKLEVARRHRTYEKVVRRSDTVHAHDAENQAQEGDTVRVVETRPLSRTKRWRLIEIVERAR
jgi:small subunit ribosomal protein S17